jgi:tetratricopeptide (TPR) repeat protein
LERQLTAAKSEHVAIPGDAARGWHLARACFDRAEYSTNNAQRAELAQQGIAVAREVLKQQSNSAPGHYYLAMNLGQLARTKTLGALRLVDEMEAEFKAARALDKLFDYAGPDRNLGRLYLEAPSIGSVGDRKLAKMHFDQAAELFPEYPENQLNLIEAALRWNQPTTARKELESFEPKLEEARRTFSGEAWVSAWLRWDGRLQAIRSSLLKPASPVRTGGMRKIP